MKQNILKKQQEILRQKFLKKGVKMISPETIFFSKDTQIGKNVTIDPYVVIGKKVKIKLKPAVISIPKTTKKLVSSQISSISGKLAVRTSAPPKKNRIPCKRLITPITINITFGLDYMRLSPDHGPAYDLVGKNKSNYLSLFKCVKFLDNLK